IRESWWALAPSLLFVVLKPPLELVVWNHLGGYLLGCLAITVGMRAFVRMAAGAAVRRDQIVYVTAFSAACLFYEALVPLAALAAILLVVMEVTQGRRPPLARAAVYLAPVALFGLLYLWHVSHVERLAYVDRPDAHGIFDAGNLRRVVPASVAALARW